MPDAREHFHRLFFATFCTFSLLRSNWMSETMGVRLGQGKKNNSLIRKWKISDPPPPPIFTDPYSGLDPYSGFELPPPPPPLLRTDPYSGLTLIPGSTLAGRLPFSESSPSLTFSSRTETVSLLVARTEGKSEPPVPWETGRIDGRRIHFQLHVFAGSTSAWQPPKPVHCMSK